jgi:hypothetical protein
MCVDFFHNVGNLIQLKWSATIKMLLDNWRDLKTIENNGESNEKQKQGGSCFAKM